MCTAIYGEANSETKVGVKQLNLGMKIPTSCGPKLHKWVVNTGNTECRIIIAFVQNVEPCALNSTWGVHGGGS